MEYFKTPAGKELPLMDIKGKKYLQVAHRLVWFREVHPNATIQTDLVKVDDEQTIARAAIYTPDEKTGDMKLRATAYKRETKRDFPDHTEKAETSAVGRALGLFGFGTQFALELDEDVRLADAPVVTRQTPTTNTESTKPNASAGGFRKVNTTPSQKQTESTTTTTTQTAAASKSSDDMKLV